MDKQLDAANAVEVSRRDLLVKGLTGAALGAAALALPTLAHAQGFGFGHDWPSAQIDEIHQLQAAFHYAKSTQNIDLMMALWAEDAVLNFSGTNYIGNAAIRAFLLTTGSFTHQRLSLVPSFKIEIDVHGEEAYLYFECIDIGDYALPTRSIASVLFNAGTVRKIRGRWQFWRMNGGPIATLSVNQYAYP
jgi:ketosteroid isomerase-like protein